MSTTTNRLIRKEKEKISISINQHIEKIRLFISDMKLDGIKCNSSHVYQLKKLIEDYNTKFNYWATKFNKKCKYIKPVFNTIRDQSHKEFKDHEYNLYKDVVIDRIFELYQIVAHEVDNLDDYLMQSYESDFSFEDACRLIRTKISYKK